MSKTKSSIPTPHAVAALLTDEQRARACAATFVRDHNGISEKQKNNGIYSGAYRRCPLAVAAGIAMSARCVVYRALGLEQPNEAVESFMEWADSISSDPADTYALLGCDDAEARP